MKKPLLAGLLACALLCQHADAAPATALHGRIDAIGSISGFHSCFNADKSLEARLLEADGAASVARNPVYLYFVLTNNGSHDYFSKIWALPFKVESVEKLEIRGDTAKITVKIDEGTDKPQPRREVFVVTWHPKNGDVGDVIDVEKEK